LIIVNWAKSHSAADFSTSADSSDRNHYHFNCQGCTGQPTSTQKHTEGDDMATSDPQHDIQSDPQHDTPQHEVKPHPQHDAEPDPQHDVKPHPQHDAKPHPQHDAKPHPQHD
jgi:outer membrane biosynthesis protein TonB